MEMRRREGETRLKSEARFKLCGGSARRRGSATGGLGLGLGSSRLALGLGAAADCDKERTNHCNAEKGLHIQVPPSITLLLGV